MKYKAVVIGTSFGGLYALKTLLPALPPDFDMPVIVVQHLGNSSENFWIEHLDAISPLRVKEADEKEKAEKGTIYIAPANYHLLMEREETFSLSIDEKVNFARPSIDVFFESAAMVYRNGLVGIIMTGSNHDGAAGLKKIKDYGGLAIVQDPGTAESSTMPRAALARVKVDHILPLEKISELLISLN